MTKTRRIGLRAIALLGLLLLVLPATAQAWIAPLPVGDPIENDTWWIRPIEGSSRIEAARASDPDGGPDWAIGTFRARIDLFPPEAPDATCTVLGRVQAGQLGMPTEHGLFRPFALGAGAGFCSTTPPDLRGPITGVNVGTSVLTDTRCVPRTIPEEPSIPECDPALVRTLHSALLGPGDFRAWAMRDGARQPVPMEADGSLLVVGRGVLGSAAIPVVSFRVCGPNSRPDLLDFAPWGVVRGCLKTIPIVPAFPGMSKSVGLGQQVDVAAVEGTLLP